MYLKPYQMITFCWIHLSPQVVFCVHGHTPDDTYVDIIAPEANPHANLRRVQFYVGPVGSGAPMHFHS